MPTAIPMMPSSPTERAEDDIDIATIRAALDESQLAAAWAEGRAMTLEQAVAYALDEQESPQSLVHEPRPSTSRLLASHVRADPRAGRPDAVIGITDTSAPTGDP
jgi:hypothetical protein